MFRLNCVVSVLCCLMLVGCTTWARTPETIQAMKPVVDSVASSECKKPAYPLISFRQGEQGTVALKSYVEASGNVASIEVTKSSGFPRLDQAALEHAKCWRFVPGRVNGAPTPMWHEFTIDFNLT